MKYIYNERINIPSYARHRTIKDLKEGIKIIKDHIRLAKQAITILDKLSMPNYGVIKDVIEYKRDQEAMLSDEEKALKWLTDNKISDTTKLSRDYIEK